MVVFSKVKLGVTPDINALATIIIVVVSAGVVAAGVMMRRQERQRERDMRMAAGGD
jgi:putrescine transport system permease protein